MHRCIPVLHARLCHSHTQAAALGNSTSMQAAGHWALVLTDSCSFNRGSLTESSGAEAAAREQALAQGVVLSKDTPSAEEAAAATIQQQALAAADAAHQVRPASSPAPTLTHAPTTHDAASQHCQSQTLRGVQAQPPSQGQQARPSQAVPAKQAAQHAQQIGRKKSHQNRRQLVPLADKAVSPQVASDSAGRFTGFES